MSEAMSIMSSAVENSASSERVIKSIACAASSTITKLWSASLSMSIITTSARSLSIETKVCSSIVLYNYIVIN